MSAFIQQGGDIPTLPAGRGGSSSPAGYGSTHFPSTVAAASGHCECNGEQPGITIAALYVAKNGCYFGLPSVDPWDQERDARLYAGPHPVVAHPPCERWGKYYGGAPSTWPRKIKGDDDGCFKAALAAVRQWGGVIEHPACSFAWDAFGLNKPPVSGGWVAADFLGGWTCHVEQGAYGHRARKATWLYACGVDLPSLKWGPAQGDFDPTREGMSDEQKRRARKTGICQRLSRKQRMATPLPFRDLLLSIASTARRALSEAA